MLKCFRMVLRKYWLKLLESAWKRKSVVWLSGVRRAGKTFLCRSIPQIEYFDCELPRVRRQMEDPEDFLSKLKNKRIVLDEIHRLPNPSESKAGNRRLGRWGLPVILAEVTHYLVIWSRGPGGFDECSRFPEASRESG